MKKHTPYSYCIFYLERKYCDKINKELKEKGISCDIKEIEEQIAARDKNDMTREISPLKQADDAILIDNTALSEKQVEDIIISKVKEVYAYVV